jgi:hypothetical protein
LAVTTIAHKPDLTAEQAKEIFQKHFEPKCKVEGWKGPNVGSRRDFVVVKNDFIGVSVKLEQTQGETKFVYSGLAPRIYARILGAGMISVFLWGRFVSEVRHFIETAPEFK